MTPPTWGPWQTRAILAGYAVAILGTLAVVMAVGVVAFVPVAIYDALDGL